MPKIFNFLVKFDEYLQKKFVKEPVEREFRQQQNEVTVKTVRDKIKKKNKMNKCLRNILLIFGYLLIMAFIFIPYSIGTGKGSGGYMFLPIFINKKINWSFPNYIINIDLLITEIALILFAGGFAYILFCVVLKKSEKREERDDKAEGPKTV